MLFVAGSRKFFKEMDNFVKLCKENGIEAKTSGKLVEEKDTLENQKDALLKAFRMIDASDLVYIFAKDGYIGKTVAMEIAYAFAKGKRLVASEVIDELSAMAMVSEIIPTAKLARGKSI